MREWGPDDLIFLVIFVVGCSVFGYLGYQTGFNHGSDACVVDSLMTSSF